MAPISATSQHLILRLRVLQYKRWIKFANSIDKLGDFPRKPLSGGVWDYLAGTGLLTDMAFTALQR